MSETAAQRADAVQAVVLATQNSDSTVQRAAMEALIPPPSGNTNNLWMAVIVGLLALLLIALGGVLYLLADGDDGTSPDLALTAFASLLAGLLGLFAPSPSGSGTTKGS